MEVGTRLELVDEQTQRMERIVYAAVPEAVSSVVSVGATGWNPAAASQGQINLALSPATKRGRSNVEIADDLRQRLTGNIPGMEVRTRAPQGQFLLDRLLGADEGLIFLRSTPWPTGSPRRSGTSRGSRTSTQAGKRAFLSRRFA